ncbi:hypothetical protein [Methylobacterium frigidaeris]|uniref:hypothetical protein n=1 Tax=Methylobacterium frigidaeris TaxID=2038277 RepID=UPI001EDE4FF0|nr:hypothetical protein [Methylobacterium frigidaeris]
MAMSISFSRHAAHFSCGGAWPLTNGACFLQMKIEIYLGALNVYGIYILYICILQFVHIPLLIAQRLLCLKDTSAIGRLPALCEIPTRLRRAQCG